jgi:hypothetical protein
MNEFHKLSSTSQSKRLNSHVTILTASRREIEYRDKLKHLERKVSLDMSNREKQHKNQLKWNSKAEANLMFKHIFNNNQPPPSSIVKLHDTDLIDTVMMMKNKRDLKTSQQLTPSVDEWIKMRSTKNNQKTTIQNSKLTSNSMINLLLSKSDMRKSL